MQDVVHGSHGLVHQFVQLVGGGAGGAGGLLELLETGPASLWFPPGRSGSQARLPVGRGEGEKVVDAGLDSVPLRRQVVHLVPVDLPGGEEGADQQEQQEQQEGLVVSAITTVVRRAELVLHCIV